MHIRMNINTHTKVKALFLNQMSSISQPRYQMTYKKWITGESRECCSWFWSTDCPPLTYLDYGVIQSYFDFVHIFLQDRIASKIICIMMILHQTQQYPSKYCSTLFLGWWWSYSGLWCWVGLGCPSGLNFPR